MIQDINPKRMLNQFKNPRLTDEDYIMFFADRMLLLKNEDEISYPTYGEIKQICEMTGCALPECRFLFDVEDEEYFLGDYGACEDTVRNALITAGYQFYRMQEIRRMQPKDAVFAGATAWHLYNWYRINRFCGACGVPMVHDGKERMMRCEKCGNMVFPKIVPAVIVALTDGDRIMLTKYADREYKRYALIAGFTEIGETMEETVAREVMEEVGLKVKNVTYYKSQPWGFDSDMLLGFFCELDGSGEIKMDATELSVAEWVHYKDMETYNEGLSLTEEMMNYFKSTRERMDRTIR